MDVSEDPSLNFESSQLDIMCNASMKISYLHGFEGLNKFHFDLCQKMASIEDELSLFLLHLMHIPVITLIIITLLDKNKEDVKWFVFHTAVLNLILGIFWELIFIVQDIQSYAIVLLIVDFSLNLSVNSIFPLAFTRFFYLYFSDYYEKIFTPKTLFPIILAYDLVNIGLFYLDSRDNENSFVMLGVDFFLLIGTLTCSTFIFLKIRKMMELVGNDSNFNTYNDLRRAAFVCIFQTCLISLHLASTFYTQLFSSSLCWNDHLFDLLFVSFMILSPLQYPLYQLFIIIDSLMTLIVLKSYRSAFVNVFKKIWDVGKKCLNRLLRSYRYTTVTPINQNFKN